MPTDDKRTSQDERQPKKSKSENPRDPLTKKIEKAMIDQDIPVETGIRPRKPNA